MQIPSKGIDDDDLWRRSDLRSGSVCSAACPLPQFLQRSLRTPMSSDWLTNCRSARWSALSCTVNPWCSQNAFVQYVFGGSLLYFVVSFSGFFSVGTPPPVCIRRGFVSWNAISSVFSPRSTPPIFSMWARNLRGLRGKHNLFNFLLFFCSTHFCFCTSAQSLANEQKTITAWWWERGRGDSRDRKSECTQEQDTER